MNPATARRAVLVSMIALAAISVYRVRSEQGSLYKRLWGTGVIGVALSLMADFAPSIAGPFAILTVLGSLTHGGDQAVQNLLSGASNIAGGGKVATTGGASVAATSTKGGVPR